MFDHDEWLKGGFSMPEDTAKTGDFTPALCYDIRR
jgi:hypothetical protein